MKSTLLFITLFITSVLCAQNPDRGVDVGLLFDMNENMIDGLFENDYLPKELFQQSHNVDEDFTPGYYYDNKNRRVKGWLKRAPDSDFIKFKEQKDGADIKLATDKCIAFVIGKDSFTIAKNFDIERALTTSHVDGTEFVQVLDSVNNVYFYAHYRWNKEGSLDTYLTRMKGSNRFQSFSQDKDLFSIQALSYFGECPALKYRLLKKKLCKTDIPNMIRHLKYYQFAKYGKQLFFLSSWNLTSDTSKATMYGKLSTKDGNNITISYFYKDGTPIFKGNLSSFLPEKRVGEYAYFYPNGSIRKKENYSMGFKDTTMTYYPDGKLQLKYVWEKKYSIFTEVDDSLVFLNGLIESSETLNNPTAHNVTKRSVINTSGQPTSYPDKIGKRLRFIEVRSSDGQNCLDARGNGSIDIDDFTNQRKVTLVFAKNQLASAFYLRDQDEKVYLFCEHLTQFSDLTYMESKFAFDVKYPFEIESDESSGIVLLKCLVEPSGLVSDYQILKGLNPDVDHLVNMFFGITKVAKKMKPAMVDKKAVPQEIVIPFLFTYTNNTSYHSYNNYWYMHNTMFINQQQMMAPKFTPNTHF